MQENIKHLYDQSQRDPEHAHAYHSLVFDIEAFAQRAMAAKLAQLEGRDAYTDIMQKYGAETATNEGGQQLNFHKVGEEIPLVGEEINELTPNPIDDIIAQQLVEQVRQRALK